MVIPLVFLDHIVKESESHGNGIEKSRIVTTISNHRQKWGIIKKRRIAHGKTKDGGGKTRATGNDAGGI